jgi:hypothetical protein
MANVLTIYFRAPMTFGQPFVGTVSEAATSTDFFSGVFIACLTKLEHFFHAGFRTKAPKRIWIAKHVDISWMESGRYAGFGI